MAIGYVVSCALAIGLSRLTDHLVPLKAQPFLVGTWAGMLAAFFYLAYVNRLPKRYSEDDVRLELCKLTVDLVVLMVEKNGHGHELTVGDVQDRLSEYLGKNFPLSKRGCI